MKMLVKQLLPSALRSAARGAYEDAADLADRLRGRQNNLSPPRKLIRNIGGNFAEAGGAFLRHFIELCDLQPDESVLDVGCGVGRMAVPLTTYLGDSGSYEGFDIDAKEIEWCSRHITSKHPNFRFRVADIYNKLYNSGGKCRAAEYTFPYADNSFDFVFLTSVCTHLLPPDMAHYLSEVCRVLKPEKRCLITFFILNGESTNLVELTRTRVPFGHDHGQYRIASEETPESAVAYDEAFIRTTYERCGLTINEPIRYGSWCDRPTAYDYQDIITASKR